MVKLSWDSKDNKVNNVDDPKKGIIKSFNIYDTIPKPINPVLEKGWINSIYWGDNLDASLSILNEFKGKIKLIYIDPPFFSGANYRINVSEKGNDYYSIAYFDNWNSDLDSYLQMLFERIQIFYQLLSKDGLLFIHLDYHAYHYVKIILDEIFGKNRFINEIIWYYYNKYSAGKNHLPKAHDNILVYSKSNKYTFNEIRLLREKPHKQLKRVMINGVLKNLKDKEGHVVYRIVTDKKLDDVWKIPCLQPASREWTGFPTQKHHKLIERIIKIGSNEEDIIADFFCGSGTTLLVAESLKRKWIGCDISPYSIYITRKRLINYISSKGNEYNEYYPIAFFYNSSEENLNLIESGFFEKDLEIKRK